MSTPPTLTALQLAMRAVSSQTPSMPGPIVPPPRPDRDPAAQAVKRLEEEIADFESKLSAEQEVGGVIVGAPGQISFHIHNFYKLNMDIIVFEGVDQSGKPLRLVQHVSQLSILLTALPKLHDAARRIGFQPPPRNLDRADSA